MDSLALTLTWIRRLAAVALIQQAAEMLALKKSWSHDGIWSWSVLQKEFVASASLKKFFSLFLSAKGYQTLLWLQLASALVLLAFPASISLRSMLIAICLLATLLTAIRWRGTFNGGSDCMTIVVLLSLALATLCSTSEIAEQACLWWISVQICLSFFISGMIKIRQPDWRSGLALVGFLGASSLGVPTSSRTIARSPFGCRVLSWAVILFECSFPLALLDHRLAIGYSVVALVFQITNFYIFGLNRFLFAWMAAYPALLFCSR